MVTVSSQSHRLSLHHQNGEGEGDGEGDGEGHSLFCGVSRNSIDCGDSIESLIPFPKVERGLF